MTNLFNVEWNEDGSATVLGRVTARNGSGAATGEDGEGNWLQQADVDTITCDVFDLDSATPNTAIASPSVTATLIIDTPVTTNVIWTKDTVGYNFLHDLAATNFPTGLHRYSVEYLITLTGGEQIPGTFVGRARPRRAT